MGKEEFFDEQIIDMMNKAEQKKESSKVNQSETVEERNIYTGVRIFGKWIYFERSSFGKRYNYHDAAEEFCTIRSRYD